MASATGSGNEWRPGAERGAPIPNPPPRRIRRSGGVTKDPYQSPDRLVNRGAHDEE
jgi:hypothetical protein